MLKLFFYTSTCFERYVLNIRRSKLYYTATVIITPVGGRPVHRLREEYLCPDSVQFCGLLIIFMFLCSIIMWSQPISLFSLPCSLLFFTYFIIYSFSKPLLSFSLFAINYNHVLNFISYFFNVAQCVCRLQH